MAMGIALSLRWMNELFLLLLLLFVFFFPVSKYYDKAKLSSGRLVDPSDIEFSK